jgi:hypothetical protein
MVWVCLGHLECGQTNDDGAQVCSNPSCQLPRSLKTTMREASSRGHGERVRVPSVKLRITAEECADTDFAELLDAIRPYLCDSPLDRVVHRNVAPPALLDALLWMAMRTLADPPPPGPDALTSLTTQEDGLRKIVRMDPKAEATTASRAIAQHLATDVDATFHATTPAMIITLPGATRQAAHADTPR